MSYSNTIMSNPELSQIQQIISSLPTHGKKIFIKAFNEAKGSYDEDESMKIGWSAVKRYYKKVDSKWVLKRDIETKAVVAKSGFFFPTHYFDAELTNTMQDSDGHRVSDTLIQNLYKTGKIQIDGDFEHLKLLGDKRYVGAYKLIKSDYNDGALRVKFALDRGHRAYDKLVSVHKKKKVLGLSAEFYDPVIENGVIVNSSGLGWTVTDNASNRRSLFKAM